MENKLKNCPFCGGKAELKKIKGFNLLVAAYIQCLQCNVQGKPYKTEKAAIEQWNERAEIRTLINKETIKIKYFNDNIDKLRYIDGKSDWIDLHASETIILKKGEFYLIPLGVAMELPEGYEAIITPRSSTFKNYGIMQTNSIGIIDNSYCGDSDQWMMPVYATRDTIIHMNDRICQFRIIKNQPEIKFNETDALKGNIRGGFGSTGID